MTPTCADLSKMIFKYWNERDPESLLTLYRDDYADHTKPEGTPEGKDWVKMQYDIFTNAFSDLQIEIEDMVETGDKVATRVLITGTHDGELMGIPATGKKVSIDGMGIHTAENGLCAESWFYMDEAKMMQQLGVM